jgi:putative FmdB family regulatory protein
MPTYDYRCRTCGVAFEARRAIADADAPIACPSEHVGATRSISSFIAAKPGEAPRSGTTAEIGCGPGCSCAVAH